MHDTIAIAVGFLVGWPVLQAVYWFFKAEGPWNWRTLISYDRYLDWLDGKDRENSN